MGLQPIFHWSSGVSVLCQALLNIYDLGVGDLAAGIHKKVTPLREYPINKRSPYGNTLKNDHPYRNTPKNYDPPLICRPLQVIINEQSLSFDANICCLTHNQAVQVLHQMNIIFLIIFIRMDLWKNNSVEKQFCLPSNIIISLFIIQGCMRIPMCRL